MEKARQAQEERRRISWCKECKKEIWSGEHFDIIATTCQGVYTIRAKHQNKDECIKDAK
jgi:uncharacterized protein with PIN domain